MAMEPVHPVSPVQPVRKTPGSEESGRKSETDASGGRPTESGVSGSAGDGKDGKPDSRSAAEAGGALPRVSGPGWTRSGPVEVAVRPESTGVAGTPEGTPATPVGDPPASPGDPPEGVPPGASDLAGRGASGGEAPPGASLLPEWVLKGLPDSLRQAFVMWWSAHRLTPGEAPIAAAFARWGWPMDVNLIRLARQLWTGPPLHEDIGRILACLEGAERAGNPGDSLSGPEPAAAAPRKTADEKQISLPELRAGLRHRLQQWLGGGAMPESDSSGVGGRSPDLGHGMRNLRDLSGVEALRAWIRSVAAGFGEEGASRGESIPVVDGGTFRGTVMQLLSLWSNRESGLSQEVSGAVRRVLTALAAEAGLSITGTGHPWVYQCVFIPVTVGSGPETLRLHVWRWAGRREPEHMEDGPYVLTSAWNFPRWGHVEIALVVFGSAARLHVYGDRQIRSFLVRLPWSELQATLSGTGLRLDPVSIEPLRNPESGPPLSPWDLGIGPWERRV